MRDRMGGKLSNNRRTKGELKMNEMTVLIIVTAIICVSAIIVTFLLLKFSCKHKYKIIKQVPCDSDDFGTYTRYYLQCEHCGKIKIEPN